MQTYPLSGHRNITSFGALASATCTFSASGLSLAPISVSRHRLVSPTVLFLRMGKSWRIVVLSLSMEKKIQQIYTGGLDETIT